MKGPSYSVLDIAHLEQGGIERHAPLQVGSFGLPENPILGRESKMKIAFIGARGVPHGYASAEQLALNVGKRLVARGHEFTVYCHKNLFTEQYPYHEGIKRIFIPTIEHKLFGQLIQATLSGIHSIFSDYDVVHVHCLTNTYQSILPWLIRRNIVINVDGQEWDNPKWPKSVRHIFFKSAVYVTLAMCEEIITDANGMYDLYMKRYNRPSTIIEYGADIIDTRRPEVAEKYGLSSKGYFFYAARLVPSNQTDRIVHAFVKSHSQRVLAIAGGGSYESEFYKTLGRIDDKRIKFLGLVSNQQDMEQLYANAYAYLHGSTLGGINSGIVRPMGAGCPVLAFDTPFNREALELPDGKLCGRLWGNDDELVRLVELIDSAPDMVQELSALSMQQIRRSFSWDMIADQYEVFYRGFVERWTQERVRKEVSDIKEFYQSNNSRS